MTYFIIGGCCQATLSLIDPVMPGVQYLKPQRQRKRRSMVYCSQGVSLLRFCLLLFGFWCAARLNLIDDGGLRNLWLGVHLVRRREITVRLVRRRCIHDRPEYQLLVPKKYAVLGALGLSFNSRHASMYRCTAGLYPLRDSRKNACYYTAQLCCIVF